MKDGDFYLSKSSFSFCSVGPDHGIEQENHMYHTERGTHLILLYCTRTAGLYVFFEYLQHPKAGFSNKTRLTSHLGKHSALCRLSGFTKGHVITHMGFCRDRLKINNNIATHLPLL